MSDRVEYFDATIPAGTPVGSPVTLPMVFDQGNVTQIEVKIPPGPSGNVGFHIQAGGSQYVPRTLGAWIIADDDYLIWPMDNAINSGSWALSGYNTDIYDHTLYVSFHVNELQAPLLQSPGQLGFSAAVLGEAVS